MRLTTKQLAELANKGNRSAGRALKMLQDSPKAGAIKGAGKPSSQYSLCGLLAEQLNQIKAPTYIWEGSPGGEHRFHPNRRWRLDFYFPNYELAVEVEGGVSGHRLGTAQAKDGTVYQRQSRHLTPKGYEEDRIKYFEAAKQGITVISVTSKMVSDHRAISMAIQLLEARGWKAPASAIVDGYRAIITN